MRRLPGAASAWWLVMLSALIAAAAWWWQTSLRRSVTAASSETAVARLQEAYPLQPSAPAAPSVPSGVLEKIAEANPFSIQRRAKPAMESAGPGGASAGGLTKPAPAPQFIYKGRVELGNRRRAILAETTSGKTYFLEVGQEVAGFKVLDITENQVLLSNVQTREDVTVTLSTPARP